MFITFDKKKILAILGVAVVISALLMLGNLRPAQTFSINKTIVIDAGHGGIDGGVVGDNTGTKESEINLAISRCLKGFLEDAGYKVVMTRTTEDSLKRGKLKDMEARRDVILSANADLVISVHQNEYSRSYVKGAQVFYAPDGKYEDIASVMQGVLNDKLGNSRNAAKGDYYILQCTSVPSLLVECGFLSNPDEEKLLITPEYQQKVAYAVFCGINRILDLDSAMLDAISSAK